MDHHQLFFSSQAHLDPNGELDPIIAIFDQGFDDFMFSDAGFLDSYVFDSGIGLPLDALVGSPGHNLSLEEDRERNSGDGNFSGTGIKPKRDRSKTLVSERRRRSRMKEKLYELRSLVPNITKVSLILLHS